MGANDREPIEQERQLMTNIKEEVRPQSLTIVS
jgi:hypothetical protein